MERAGQYREHQTLCSGKRKSVHFREKKETTDKEVMHRKQENRHIYEPAPPSSIPPIEEQTVN